MRNFYNTLKQFILKQFLIVSVFLVFSHRYTNLRPPLSPQEILITRQVNNPQIGSFRKKRYQYDKNLADKHAYRELADKQAYRELADKQAYRELADKQAYSAYKLYALYQKALEALERADKNLNTDEQNLVVGSLRGGGDDPHLPQTSSDSGRGKRAVSEEQSSEKPDNSRKRLREETLQLAASPIEKGKKAVKEESPVHSKKQTKQQLVGSTSAGPSGSKQQLVGSTSAGPSGSKQQLVGSTSAGPSSSKQVLFGDQHNLSKSSLSLSNSRSKSSSLSESSSDSMDREQRKKLKDALVLKLQSELDSGVAFQDTTNVPTPAPTPAINTIVNFKKRDWLKFGIDSIENCEEMEHELYNDSFDYFNNTDVEKQSETHKKISKKVLNLRRELHLCSSLSERYCQYSDVLELLESLISLMIHNLEKAFDSFDSFDE